MTAIHATMSEATTKMRIVPETVRSSRFGEAVIVAPFRDRSPHRVSVH
jgi:hypothetical protein